MIETGSLTTVVVALVAAVPPTVMAYAAVRSSRLNSVKADQIIDKATEIKTQTDGQLTKVMGALSVANEKIVGLEKLIAEMNKIPAPSPIAPTKSKK